MARPGQEGFVGGSMGDESVILEGVESEENEDALYTTVHGAGRVMSRSQAAGRVRRRKWFLPPGSQRAAGHCLVYQLWLRSAGTRAAIPGGSCGSSTGFSV